MRERCFATEADLVRAFCAAIPKPEAAGWTAYHETAGWDLLLAHSTGTQVGIEAKLSLNAKVLEQALPGHWADASGPDYRAVLVPADGLQNHLSSIAAHLGIVVICVSGLYRARAAAEQTWIFRPALPDQQHDWGLDHWPSWCPAQRCRLPDYVPDVEGGRASPVRLSEWKIKAIKLLILLDRRGYVTRHDMKVLGISPTRWTDHWNGFLTPGDGGYLRNGRTPDLKAQHPTNWGQIEADLGKWGAVLLSGDQLRLEPAR